MAVGFKIVGFAGLGVGVEDQVDAVIFLGWLASCKSNSL